MKRTIGSEDLIGAVESKLSIPTSQFHCPFVSFSAAVAKENSIKAAILN
jgi:hypothetical protein